jgi:hypothetical protein
MGNFGETKLWCARANNAVIKVARRRAFEL